MNPACFTPRTHTCLPRHLRIHTKSSPKWILMEHGGAHTQTTWRMRRAGEGRKGAWGLKCEMREDGIRTERGEGQLYGQKKDVNAWKIRRNKLWSASLAMAMEEREEASGKNLYVRTASVLWWAERCFLSTHPSSSLAVPLSLALPFRMR